MKRQPKKSTTEVVGFIGVGLDNDDGAQRISRSDHFVIVGGSAKTHEHMQDSAIRFDAAVQREGRPLREMPLDEVLIILRESQRPS